MASDDTRLVRKSLGVELRARRHALGMTQVDVARLLPYDIGETAVGYWEKGTRTIPMDRFLDVCRVLRIPAWELLRAAMERATGRCESCGKTGGNPK